MNLVWFLTIGTFVALIFGEFGRFPFGGGGLSVTVYDLMLGLTVVFLLVWQIGIKRNLSTLKVLLLWLPFWIVAVLSLLVSGHLQGGFYLIRFIFYCLSFWIGFCLIKEKVTSLEMVNKLLASLGGVISVLGIIQLLVFSDLRPLTPFGFDPHQGRLVATFLDPNFVGSFLNITLAITFYSWVKTPKKWKVFLAALICSGIILTFSRSAYLFLITQCLIWGIFKYRKLLILLLVINLVLYLSIPKFSERIIGGFRVDKSSIERFYSWQNGLLVFQSSPVLGVGFNNLRLSFDTLALTKTYSEDGGHAGAGVDSSLLFVLATTGILGLIAFLYFWSRIVFGKYSSQLGLVIRGLLLGVLVNSQFINSLFFPPVMLVLLFWLGMCWSVKESR